MKTMAQENNVEVRVLRLSILSCDISSILLSHKFCSIFLAATKNCAVDKKP